MQLHEQCRSSHISERLIYSCKSYFKWLTSKLLVYRAKWRAAAPFQGSHYFFSILFLPQNWAAERGEFNLYEKTPALCKSTVQYKEALPVSLLFFSSFIPQHLKGNALDCSFTGSALEHTFCSLITHLSACLLQLDKVHENAFCRPVPSCIIKKKLYCEERIVLIVSFSHEKSLNKKKV